MGFIAYLIITAILGLFVGALARLALPGRDPMSLFQTMLVGIGGSLIGGPVASVLFPAARGPFFSFLRAVPVVFPIGGLGPCLLFHAAGGLFFSFLGAFLIVYLIRRSRGGGLTSPGAPR